jgi:hypothetical protein
MRVWIYLKRWKYTKRDKIRGVRKKSTKSGWQLIREIVYMVENPGTRLYTQYHHSSPNLRGDKKAHPKYPTPIFNATNSKSLWILSKEYWLYCKAYMDIPLPVNNVL